MTRLNTTLAFCLTLAVFLTPATRSHAQDMQVSNPTQAEKVFYQITYGGLPMGKIWLWWEENDAHYKLTMSMKTSGLVRVFSKKKRLSELFGNRLDERYLPLHYSETVTYPHKQRSAVFTYDGGIISNISLEPAKPLEISDEQQSLSIDPLSALLKLTEFMNADHDSDAAFFTPIFDGKRYLHITASPTTSAPEGCTDPCRAYEMTRTPIIGYSDEEMQRHAAGEPPLTMLHHRGERFPHVMTLTTGLGTVRIERAKED